MKLAAADLLNEIPGPITAKWPMGERFAQGFAHGTMSVELYAPQDHDPQTPHAQDELYVVLAGQAVLVIEGVAHSCTQGDVLFVKAGQAHCFTEFSADFATWVIFYGVAGGEAAA